MQSLPIIKNIKPSILVVDDEPLTRMLLSRRLGSDGYSVLTACNGEEAIHHLSVERFDLLLLDLDMPIMNGYEVLKWLHQHDNNGMRTIILSADDKRDAINTCLTLGAIDYLLKSASVVEIMHRVRRACDDIRLEQQLGSAQGNVQRTDIQILLVDDDAMSMGLILRHFKQDKINTYIASDGHVALKLLEHLPIDLVLLDYQMPGLNGLEVLEQIRQHRQYDDIGVIMVTAEQNPDLINRIFTAGADDYLAKPFHATELMHRAANVLLDKRLRQTHQRLSGHSNMARRLRSGQD